MCGIFAAFNIPHAAFACYAGLHAQQHRAVEFCGIVSTDGTGSYRHIGKGPVAETFNEDLLNTLPGTMAVGHIRYSTVQDLAGLDNTQPVLRMDGSGFVALAHNGNLINVPELERIVTAPRSSSMDTELIVHLFCSQPQELAVEEKIKRALSFIRGSYCLVFMFKDTMVVVRDPSGNRPLCLGAKDNGYVIASEDCAFAPLRAKLIREIQPGEILKISSSGLSQSWLDRTDQRVAECSFEHSYFAYPSSNIFDQSVSRFRRKQGELLEQLCPAPFAKTVVAVPDSSTFIAAGYAQSGRSGQLARGILRSHYIGRTFIEHGQKERIARVNGKFQPVPEEMGTDIVLVDDSIVRLNTLPPLVELLRFVGVEHIDVRIGTPMIVQPCFYGINTPTKEELAANSMTVDQMCRKIGADSLEFMPMEAFRSLFTNPTKKCFACMGDPYPIV